MRRRIYQLGFGLAAAWLSSGWSSGPANAQTSEDVELSSSSDIDGWFDHLARLGDTRAVEPAGARGSMGVGLGAGVAVMPAEVGGRLAAIEMDGPRPETGDRHASPRVWLVKGLPLPVDVGITGGADTEQTYSVFGANVQWTIYEAFQLPAVAVRAAAGRLFGLDHTTYRSESAELVVGWGFLRYFTVFGTIGVVRHTASLALDSEDDTSYLLTAESTTALSRTWREPRRTGGLRVTLWPPFVSASAEATIGDTRQYAAKLSFGM